MRYKARAGIAPGSHQGATLPRASRRILGTVKEIKKEVNAAAPGSSGVRREYRIKGAPGLQLRVSASGTALQWAQYLETHAARTYASMTIASADAARAIIAKVKS